MARKPDFKMRAWIPDTKQATTIGAAWLSEDGSLTIKINPCVVISWKDDIVIKLFPTADDNRGD